MERRSLLQPEHPLEPDPITPFYIMQRARKDIGMDKRYAMVKTYLKKEGVVLASRQLRSVAFHSDRNRDISN